MMSSEPIDINIREIHLYRKCKYYYANEVYATLLRRYFDERLRVLLNYFFYKKLQGLPLYMSKFFKKWNSLVPLGTRKKNQKLNAEFFNMFKDVFNTYVNVDDTFDIKCLCNPFEIQMREYRISGSVDLIVDNGKTYDVYFLYHDIDDTKGIVHILIQYFVDELKTNDIRIIMHDIKTNNIRRYKFDGIIKNTTTKIQSALKDIRHNVGLCDECIWGKKCRHHYKLIKNKQSIEKVYR